MPQSSTPSVSADTQAPLAWHNRPMTPMLRQWVAAKQENPDAILLFRMGDFFELFFEDAKLAAELLDLTLTARDKSDNPMPMAGMPHHAVESYIARLVAAGHSVAVCDQMEDPKQAKGIVHRAVTRLVTPGTVCDLDALEPGRSPYLAALVPLAWHKTTTEQQPSVAVALLDLLAGELLMTVVATEQLGDELMRMNVREALVHPPLLAGVRAQLFGGPVALRPLEESQHSEAELGRNQSIAQACVPAALRAAPKEARAALRAALTGVLLYAENSQKRSVAHVGAPRWYHLQDFMVMDEATRQNLELQATAREGRRQGSLLAHLDRTRTPMGARLLQRWMLFPLRQLEGIAARADAVAQLAQARGARMAIRDALRAVRDLERLSGRVALGRATPRDVAALGLSMAALRDVQAAVQAAGEAPVAPIFALWHAALLPLPLAARLQEAFVDEPPVSSEDGGIFRRSIDAELDACMALTDDADAWLRAYETTQRQETGISTLKVRYNRVFGYFVELSRLQARAAPEHYVRKQTMANAERFSTQALDAFAARAMQASERRKSRERELFAAYTAEIVAALAAIKEAARLVAQIDVLASLAEVADAHRYVRPQMTQTPMLQLQQARHAVLETLLPNGERFVANDMAVDVEKQQLMVLTGPNMAGKSTLMRQAALCVLLAQMGGFVPAAAAQVGLCDRLFVRVGASDNLGRGQSTFMVEMVETASILQHATDKSLVLLDEIGRGTSTFDGLSIAWAVAEHLHDSIGCRTLFATHYHEMCALADVCPRVVIMQVAVHEEAGRVVFLRQLRPGAAMRSYGIEVARLAHLPEAVLSRARAVLQRLEAENKAPSAAEAIVAAPAAADRAPATAQPALGAAQPTAAEPAAPISAAAEDDAPVASNAQEPPIGLLPPTRRQLSLFSAPAEPSATAARAWQRSQARVVQQLVAAKLERMTPLSAMALVGKLQAELSRHERS